MIIQNLDIAFPGAKYEGIEHFDSPCHAPPPDLSCVCALRVYDAERLNGNAKLQAQCMSISSPFTPHPHTHVSKFLHFKLLILVPHPLLARLFAPSGIVRQSSVSTQS